jgi:type IV secretion system protein VirB3
MKTDLQKYASYNVLARKALICGVPILTLISFIIGMLFTGVIGVVTLGLIKGLITPLILAGGLFVIRVKCMDDSRAMEGVVWDMKGALTRLVCRSTVTSFTSTNDSKSKRKEDIHEFYKLHNIKQ